ncbi:MAG: HAD-IIA family hydrolase [Chloroflexi bacterium]|nr:HAD-IIA family hydrolase [Chloroflexota bacterium]
MLDMDGTFYLGDHLLPGALEFMKYLQEKGIDYLFLTNNSSKHGGIYADKICKMGFDVDESKIFTSGEATTIYLKNKTDYRSIFLVGTPALEEEFIEAGFNLTDKQPDAAVLGFDTTLTYEKIWKLCDLVREGLPYIATHPDFNCPTETGFMPDIGSFIALVEASTGRRPDVIIGKPHNYIVEAVVEKTGFGLDEIAMIGDRLYTDIALGKTGIMTILVLSGETKVEEVQTSEFQPDLVFRDLAELTKHLKQ